MSRRRADAERHPSHVPLRVRPRHAKGGRAARAGSGRDRRSDPAGGPRRPSCPALAWPAADPRVPDRRLRLPDRLQPVGRGGLGAADRARRAGAGRAAHSAAPDAFLARRSGRRGREASAPAARFSPTCVTICRTSPPTRAFRREWRSPTTGLSWNCRDRPLSRRPAAALAQPCAGARQLRRAAPRPREDHRPRAAPCRRARRDAGGDDLRSASAARSSVPTRPRRC